MFAYVIFELLIGFFQSCPLYSTDIALILLVSVDLIPLCSQLRESVDYYTRDNVLKEQAEEHEV